MKRIADTIAVAVLVVLFGSGWWILSATHSVAFQDGRMFVGLLGPAELSVATKE